MALDPSIFEPSAARAPEARDLGPLFAWLETQPPDPHAPASRPDEIAPRSRLRTGLRSGSGQRDAPEAPLGGATDPATTEARRTGPAGSGRPTPAPTPAPEQGRGGTAPRPVAPRTDPPSTDPRPEGPSLAHLPALLRAAGEVELRRVDPTRNMRRFYRMRLQADLFGGVALVREWGRIGTRGQSLTEPHADAAAARAALLALARIKTRRGYGVIV